MSQIVLQPSGSREAVEHYGNTITQPVKLSEVKSKLDPKITKFLYSIFPNGQVPMWGVTPGGSGANVTKWERVEPGAVVLFAGGSKIFGSGVVVTKFHSRALAKHLWGTDEESGMTWEYMYALTDIHTLNISYKEFNRAVGYKPKNVIRGINVLDEEKSQAFLDSFDLNPKRVEFPPNPLDIERAAKKLDELDELDKKYEAARRVEQAALRDHLLQGRSKGKCFFCGREFLSGFLHAAHVKKRAECTNKEKRDLRNIGMLNCVFGCDQLYERGYISVDASGQVVKSRKLTNETEKRYMESVVTSTVTVPAGQKQYFAWHLKNKFKK